MNRATTTLIASCLSLMAHGQILLNGGFEEPAVDPMQIVTPAGPWIDGWDLWDGTVILYGSGFGTPTIAGDQSLMFVGHAELEQVFPTDPGVDYVLRFSLATGTCSPASLTYDVWGLDSLASGTATTSDTPDSPAMFTAAFTAQTSLTTLAFTHDGGCRTILDSVSVSVVSTPEPEHTTLAALLMLGLFAAVRRKS